MLLKNKREDIMSNFLPTFYNFRAENVLTPNRANLNLIDKMPKWVGFIVIAIVGFLAICMLIGGLQNILEIIAGAACIALVGILSFGLYQSIDNFTTLGDPINQPMNQPYDLNCNFKLRSTSNLIVRQVKKRHPLRASDQNNYPYCFYAKSQDGNNRLIYLGKINESGKVVLSDTNNVNKLFASYYNYVQKHHLSNKFTQNLFLVKDANVTDANGIAQYVLKGDGITLKIKPNKKQSYQIYAEKD